MYGKEKVNCRKQDLNQSQYQRWPTRGSKMFIKRTEKVYP